MSVLFWLGDCRDVLANLMSESVHCIVTSPPYWGLRDYGVDGQIGLEVSPEDYVSQIVDVFREARRVLRQDGTLWLNLGDTYSVKHVGRRDHGTGAKISRLGPKRDGIPGGTEIKASGNTLAPGLKPKELVGIPWRVAFVLQADGWYLRSDIVWSKPNPMPESVTDRPTKAHEYVFLLTKSTRYFYDQDAIREPHAPDSIARIKRGRSTDHKWAHGPGSQTLATDLTRACHPSGRNARSVWSVAPKPFKGAHFATMPPELARLCILAGCPAGGTVLDPFSGAGTTGVVADSLGRHAIGIELNADYIAMSQARLGKS